MPNHTAIPPRAQEPTYLYLIGRAGSPRGPVKIGISVDPRGRLAQLQTSNARRLHIYAMQRVEDAPAFERRVHHILAAARCSGGTEWFGVSVQTARDVVRAMLAGHIVHPIQEDQPEDWDDELGRRKAARMRDLLWPKDERSDARKDHKKYSDIHFGAM